MSECPDIAHLLEGRLSEAERAHAESCVGCQHALSLAMLSVLDPAPASDCMAYEADLAAHAEGRLESSRASALHAHLMHCGDCRETLQVLTLLGADLEDVPDPVLAPLAAPVRTATPAATPGWWEQLKSFFGPSAPAWQRALVPLAAVLVGVMIGRTNLVRFGDLLPRGPADPVTPPTSRVPDGGTVPPASGTAVDTASPTATPAPTADAGPPDWASMSDDDKAEHLRQLERELEEQRQRAEQERARWEEARAQQRAVKAQRRDKIRLSGGDDPLGDSSGYFFSPDEPPESPPQAGEIVSSAHMRGETVRYPHADGAAVEPVDEPTPWQEYTESTERPDRAGASYDALEGSPDGAAPRVDVGSHRRPSWEARRCDADPEACARQVAAKPGRPIDRSAVWAELCLSGSTVACARVRELVSKEPPGELTTIALLESWCTETASTCPQVAALLAEIATPPSASLQAAIDRVRRQGCKGGDAESCRALIADANAESDAPPAELIQFCEAQPTRCVRLVQQLVEALSKKAQVAALDAACRKADAGACQAAAVLYDEADLAIREARYLRACTLDPARCVLAHEGLRALKSSRSLEPLRIGCDAESVVACLSLGNRLAEDPAQQDEAWPAFAKAATISPYAAQESFSELWHRADHPLHARAHDVLRIGCAAGQADTCLAWVAAQGPDTLKDPGAAAAAREALTRACTYDASVCVSAFSLLTNGKLLPADFDAGVRALDRGCRRVSIDACNRLASLYASGRGVAKDPQKATAYRVRWASALRWEELYCEDVLADGPGLAEYAECEELRRDLGLPPPASAP